MKLYQDLAYSQNRLLGTIVRAKDVPVMVREITEEKYICTDLTKNTNMVCPHEDIDLTPVPLGYVNYGGVASYLARVPKRRDWKQGLRKENTITIGNGYGLGKINLKELAKTIIGKYPTFKQILKTLSKNEDKKVKSLAFSREFAVDKDFTLWYRGEYAVGTVEDGEPKLLPEFDWVRDTLVEVM